MVHTLFIHLVYTSVAHNIPVHTKLSIVIYLYIQLSICILLFLIYLLFFILIFYYLCFCSVTVILLHCVSFCHENKYIKTNQIKSNHFYCHITTAQVPWWVKFLWACSRQCKKTTTAIYIWTDSAKKKKLHWSIYSAPDSAKKQQQFTYGQYIFTDCTEDNVQNTHTYTQYT